MNRVLKYCLIQGYNSYKRKKKDNQNTNLSDEILWSYKVAKLLLSKNPNFKFYTD